MKELTREKLNALAQIAAIDGHIAEEERIMLNAIALEYGFDKEDMNFILTHPEPIGDFSQFSPDERLEFMHMSLSIMQADDLIYNSEIDFCKMLAEKLNIDPAVVDVYSTRSNVSVDTFLKEAVRYVKN